jgi:hypothetical protein
MIDGIECYNVAVNIDELLKNPLLEWQFKGSATTGEIKQHNSSVKGLFFRIKDEKAVKLAGSIHKYFNEGLFNSNDFYFLDICFIINKLQSDFDINLKETKINNVEFGVNVDVDFNELSKHLVKYYCGRGMKFNDLPGIEVELAKYILKIYEKLPNVTRFEIHVKKMQYLTGRKDPICLNVLSDLLNPEIYPKLKEILIGTIDDLLFIEPIVLSQIKGENSINYKYGEYWLNLNSNQREYHLKRFRDICESSGGNWMQKQLKKNVSSKWDDLFNNPAKVPILNAHYFDLNTSFYNDDYTAKVPIENKGTRLKYTLDKMYFRHPDKILCPITELDISMQKPDSKFLSIIGLKWIYENDKPTFERLKNERLTQRWRNEPLNVQIREIAHNIRNKFNNPRNNPRNNTKNSIKKVLQHPSLFNTIEFIRPEKRKIAGL